MRRSRQHRHGGGGADKDRCGSAVCRHRPRGRLVANLGDQSHPFRHGGYFIYDQGDGTYAGHYWEEIEDSDEDEDGECFALYRFDIPADVYGEHDWARQDVASIGSTIGRSDCDDMIEEGRSPDALVRAVAMRDIASTWGWGNFGRQSTFTEEELRDCYGRDFEIFARRARAAWRYAPQQQLDLDFESDDGD